MGERDNSSDGCKKKEKSYYRTLTVESRKKNVKKLTKFKKKKIITRFFVTNPNYFSGSKTLFFE